MVVILLGAYVSEKMKKGKKSFKVIENASIILVAFRLPIVTRAKKITSGIKRACVRTCLM